MKINELNEKQKAFVREYSIDWNGTRAYRKVYGIESEDVASANSSRLLANAKIQKYLKYCKDHVEEMVHISKARVLDVNFNSIIYHHFS